MNITRLHIALIASIIWITIGGFYANHQYHVGFSNRDTQAKLDTAKLNAQVRQRELSQQAEVNEANQKYVELQNDSERVRTSLATVNERLREPIMTYNVPKPPAPLMIERPTGSAYLQRVKTNMESWEKRLP